MTILPQSITKHKEIPPANNHGIVSYIIDSGTPNVGNLLDVDLYKILFRQSDKKLFQLTSLSPITWTPLPIITEVVLRSELGAVSGVATLDSAGKILLTQLPSMADDVLEFINFAGFPLTTVAESGKIYIAKDTNICYRFDTATSAYVIISDTLALGETSTTAYRGDRGKTAYDHSQLTHDKTLVGLGNVDNTSDLNKEISTATQTALNGKIGLTGNIIPIYTDNATAITGGLVAGSLYRTGGDPDLVAIVH